MTEYEKLSLGLQIQQVIIANSAMMLAAKQSESLVLIDSCSEISDDIMKKLALVSERIDE